MPTEFVMDSYEGYLPPPSFGDLESLMPGHRSGTCHYSVQWWGNVTVITYDLDGNVSAEIDAGSRMQNLGSMFVSSLNVLSTDGTRRLLRTDEDHLAIERGAALPSDATIPGTLFYLNGVGLHVREETGWKKLAVA